MLLSHGEALSGVWWLQNVLCHSHCSNTSSPTVYIIGSGMEWRLPSVGVVVSLWLAMATGYVLRVYVLCVCMCNCV